MARDSLKHFKLWGYELHATDQKSERLITQDNRTAWVRFCDGLGAIPKRVRKSLRMAHYLALKGKLVCHLQNRNKVREDKP